MKEKIVVGLSSGVDSSVTAFLLKEQGYEVIGATIDTGMGENAAAGAIEAKRIADQLGIRHYTLDVSKSFNEQVVRPFAQAYYEAKTPNPCVLCNPKVKWAALLGLADDLEARYVATGHYSKIVQLANGRYTIEKAAVKDQSYVLYQLSQQQLSRTKMLLWQYTKDEVREIARQQGLQSAQKPDSQEICFIPDEDYAGFLESYTGRKSVPGHFVDAERNYLGDHKGLIRYTIGQRKGLGIALGAPAFVTKLCPRQNEVVLGSNEDCFKQGVLVTDVNFMMEEPVAECIEGLTGKIRYAHREEACIIKKKEDGLWECIFEEPQRAITPGQAIVWYRDHMIYGGGQVVKGFSL